MCGILGQVNFKGSKICKDKFSDALNLMAHRGPDYSDCYFDNNIALGHRRLSIIDLDIHAKQPMRSKCGNYFIIFNGEIYNFQEIKKQLQEKGYSFATSSDTEVLLNSFIEYGETCIQKFIGMFVFAIYNRLSKEIYIFRDRLGIKPLYYLLSANEFVFSSEVKAILATSDLQKKLDIKAVSSYFSFRYPVLDNSFFEGIKSLPAGSFIKIKGNHFEIKKYWDFSSFYGHQEKDFGEPFYIDNIKEILESSVKYRMVSDVPFGSFLSGGVDSSIVTALMARNTSNPVKTFTIGFEEDGHNEFEFARLVANLYKTNHHEIVLKGQDYIDTLPRLIRLKDSPLSVPNEVPLYLMAKELKKYITVVLSGEGADEIFGGYGRIFRSAFDFERMQNLEKLALSDTERILFLENFKTKYGSMNFTSELEHFLYLYNYTSYREKEELLEPDIDLRGIETVFQEKFQGIFNEVKSESYANKMMYLFEKIHILGLLNRVDSSTMAASVEARVPFVDHRLVEFAATIPVKYKLKWNNEDDQFKSRLLMSNEISEKYDTPKYILKKSYEDMLPAEVLYRKKMGFPVPLHTWFGGRFNSFARDILLSQKATSRGLYNHTNIKAWLDNNNLLNDHRFAMKVWMLVNLELFLLDYF